MIPNTVTGQYGSTVVSLELLQSDLARMWNMNTLFGSIHYYNTDHIMCITPGY